MRAYGLVLMDLQMPEMDFDGGGRLGDQADPRGRVVRGDRGALSARRGGRQASRAAGVSDDEVEVHHQVTRWHIRIAQAIEHRTDRRGANLRAWLVDGREWDGE